MDIDNITDIKELRALLKIQMVKLRETIKTPTYTYKAGEWFFFEQNEDGVFLWEEKNPTVGVLLNYDEAAEILDWRSSGGSI